MRRRSRIDEKILDGFLTRETSFLAAEEVKALVGTMRITVEELINQLLPWVSEKAVVPFSNYKVGAVCRGNSGNLYFGANIEFAGQALNSTLHAEQSSIANAMSHEETGIKALAVNAAPCGLCRQFLKEVNSADTLRIQLPGKDPILLNELLPVGFGPNDLEIKDHLFDKHPQGLSLETNSKDAVVQKALQAANTSYAPYSSSYAGVAIQTRNGQIFNGHYMENAAFNPSLLPLQACISNMIIAGRTYAEIAEVILVQQKESSVNHARITQELLRTISTTPLKVYQAS